jgi:hypothetical protein
MTAPGADAAILARIRAAVLCIWIVVVLLTPYGSYAHLPAELGTGLGIGRVLLDVEWLRHLLWSERALTVLQWLAICGAVAQLAAGRRLRWLMPVVFVTILALDALTKSLTGYVNHAQIAPLVVLLLVTVFGHAPAGAREAVWLIRLTLVLPYTFIGLHRLIEGGVEIFLGDALLQYIAQNTAGYSFYGLAWGRGLIAPAAGGRTLEGGIRGDDTLRAAVARRARVAALSPHLGGGDGGLPRGHSRDHEHLLLGEPGAAARGVRPARRGRPAGTVERERRRRGRRAGVDAASYGARDLLTPPRTRPSAAGILALSAPGLPHS